MGHARDGLRRPEPAGRQAAQFVECVAIGDQRTFVGLGDPPSFVQHEDAVVGLLRDERQAIGDRLPFAFQLELVAEKSHVSLPPDQKGAKHGCQQESGHDSAHDEGLALKRGIDFRLVDLGPQEPRRTRHPPEGSQHRHIPVVAAFHDALAATEHNGRRQVGPANGKAQVQSSMDAMPQFIQKHQLVAIAAHEHRLRSGARGGPTLDQGVKIGRWIDAQNEHAQQAAGIRLVENWDQNVQMDGAIGSVAVKIEKHHLS